MNATTKLLTTVHVASIYCRNVHITFLHQDLKIFHMTELPVKHLLLKNLHKSTSIPEVLFSTYLNLIESMANTSTQQEFKKTIMEPFLETCYTSNSAAPTCDAPFNISAGNIVDHDNNSKNIANNMNVKLLVESTRSLEEKHITDKLRYKSMRRWKRFGAEKLTVDQDDNFLLRLLSFNILAQNLLESYSYLYKDHDKLALPWESRKKLLLQEILDAQANVICLQEMQMEHLSEFLVPFKELGYDYLYKKRTNDKRDGLLFLYRSDQFTLLDYAKVELYQSGIELLSRDNVGIIAKLSLKDSPDTQIVIATTHLLYNPRRNDVRLGQIQLLLAEIERIAFVENTIRGPRYLPIILSGDFNLEPYTAVYRFITEGSFTYHGMGRNLEPTDYRCLSNLLVPPHLRVTDSCQHFDILINRLRGEGSGKVRLENSDSYDKQGEMSESSSTNASIQIEINTYATSFQLVKITDNQHANFSSGTLTHPFNMHSVYRHINQHGEMEATTHQGQWITVDYIFYSDVEPVEKYTLPTTRDCRSLPTIPNFAVGSDHLCLGASFKIRKQK